MIFSKIFDKTCHVVAKFCVCVPRYVSIVAFAAQQQKLHRTASFAAPETSERRRAGAFKNCQLKLLKSMDFFWILHLSDFYHVLIMDIKRRDQCRVWHRGFITSLSF